MPASEPENPPISQLEASAPAGRPLRRRLVTAIGLAVGAAAAGLGVLLLIVGVALAVAYPNLPDIGSLTDYRPKLPLRVFSSDGVLLGEYGEERRNFTPIAQIPQVMKDAVLAAEDARFYQHGGVDYKGDRKSTRLNSSHATLSRMPSSA